MAIRDFLWLSKNSVDVGMKSESREQWKPEPGESISLEDRDTQGDMELSEKIWVSLEWVTEILCD